MFRGSNSLLQQTRCMMYEVGSLKSYKKVTKYPNSGDLEPFLIPELCGNKISPVIILGFRAQGDTSTTHKLTQKQLKSCPEEKIKEEEKEKNIFEVNKDLFIPFIVCGVVLTTIIALFCVICLMKKKNNQNDEESTGYSTEEYEESERSLRRSRRSHSSRYSD